MNKYKEAKAWLDKINANPQWNRVDIEEPALSQLNELFEKTTPKKPIWEYDDEPICPYCREPLDGDEEHCDLCDQRIDWSEDDAE